MSIRPPTLAVNDVFTTNTGRVGGLRLDDDIRMQFGSRLRELRKRAGISQEKLAADAGIARNFVSMIENGQRNVTIRTIQKLAKGLKCSMATLMPDAQDE